MKHPVSLVPGENEVSTQEAVRHQENSGLRMNRERPTKLD